jgi:hypothetical protein
MINLRPFARQMEITHVSPVAGGMLLAYSVETCDACGTVCQAANAIKVRANVNDAKRAGLVIELTPPCEMGWSDDFGGATCGCA